MKLLLFRTSFSLSPPSVTTQSSLNLEMVKIGFLLVFSAMQCIYPESDGIPGSTVSSEACVVIPQPPQSFEAALKHMHFSWLACLLLFSF